MKPKTHAVLLATWFDVVTRQRRINAQLFDSIAEAKKYHAAHFICAKVRIFRAADLGMTLDEPSEKSANKKKGT